MSDKHFKPRMHRRIPLKVALEISGDFQGSGSILEMSEGGLSFASSKPATKGARVRLAISDAEGALHLPGVVVHMSERAGEHVAGVQFDALPAALVQDIKALLKRHRFSMFRSPVPR